MASAIEDVGELPGEKVSDQMGQEIGTIKEVYGIGENNEPMWVTLESKSGMIEKGQVVWVPLARLKKEDDQLRVPYSANHVENCPEVEASDEISTEDERKLRDHYGIDRADQEMRADNENYTTKVPEAEGQPHKIDPESAGSAESSAEGDDSGEASEPAEGAEREETSTLARTDAERAHVIPAEGAEREETSTG